MHYTKEVLVCCFRLWYDYDSQRVGNQQNLTLILPLSEMIMDSMYMRLKGTEAWRKFLEIYLGRYIQSVVSSDHLL